MNWFSINVYAVIKRSGVGNSLDGSIKPYVEWYYEVVVAIRLESKLDHKLGFNVVKIPSVLSYLTWMRNNEFLTVILWRVVKGDSDTVGFPHQFTPHVLKILGNNVDNRCKWSRKLQSVEMCNVHNASVSSPAVSADEVSYRLRQSQ